jgi:hypothetical protein
MARTSQAGSIAAVQALLPAAGTWWITLTNTDPSTTGATELPGITRQAFTASAGTAAIPSVVSNTNALTVPNTGATQANYWAIYDAVTAGNYRTGGALASPVTGASITIAIGAITVALA